MRVQRVVEELHAVPIEPPPAVPRLLALVLIVERELLAGRSDERVSNELVADLPAHRSRKGGELALERGTRFAGNLRERFSAARERRRYQVVVGLTGRVRRSE